MSMMTDDVRRLQLSFDDHFQPSLVTHGRALLAQRQVTVGVPKIARGKLRITGVCPGARGKKYKQDIQLSHNGRRVTHVAGVCTCPDGFNCEHVVAVLVQWQGEAVREEAKHVPDQAGQGMSGEILHWLQEIEHHGSPAGGSTGDEASAAALAGPHIRYVLTAGDGRLALYKMRPAKDGGPGKAELLRPDLHQLTWGNVPS